MTSSCPYDDHHFDYEDYWCGREYENEAEKIALKRLLSLIEPERLEKGRVLDVGAGFGRLAPIYLSLVKEGILLEPARKLAKLAEEKLKKRQDRKNFKVVQATIEEVKFPFLFDLIIMIRVIHHLFSPERVIKKIASLLSPGGYFILEFANKKHFKSFFNLLFQGRIGDYFSNQRINLSSRQNEKTIPFYNYSPAAIEKMLKKNNLVIQEKLSVSNFRSPLVKKIVPLSLLLEGEKLVQRPLAGINFGPSIFLLARKI